MSVIVLCVLLDVCDGLKFVYRRILYVMNEIGFIFDKFYRKFVIVVGYVFVKYYLYGDAVVYESFV